MMRRQESTGLSIKLVGCANALSKICARHSERLHGIIAVPGPKRDEFLKFLDSLRENLNPAVSEEEAADMLVQHALTKPVFDAVFGDYDFAGSNVVSMAMQKTVDLLHEEIPEKEMKALNEFYQSVAERAEGIDNAEGRQRVIYELYDKFFRTAFPKMSEQLGIVYTPVECVDFIINSVEDVLRKEFGQSLTDRNVHVIDPFTGTGTFMTRLLQSGHIKPKDLPRKYAEELHANEIVLLAYYIASINIENVYHDLMRNEELGIRNDGDAAGVRASQPSQPSQLLYTPFEGICLTDTFALDEKDGAFETNDDQQNSARVQRQRKSPIRIVIGNPPYSVGQKSVNDNAQNQRYPRLEEKIAETYARKSSATTSKGLYDSYIKAFRWATDHLADGKGIVAFISNARWLDASAMDGFRATLQDEFDSIYVFNLRGNCRTSGELRKKEAGNVFGLGSRTPIAITLLVRNGGVVDTALPSTGGRAVSMKPPHPPSTGGGRAVSMKPPHPPSTGGRAVSMKPPHRRARIYYRDIGDYLSREKKLEIVKDLRSILDPKMHLVEIMPNEKNDWINQRDGLFDSLIPIGDKDDTKDQTAFLPQYSLGLNTNRDTWSYNFSREQLLQNMSQTIAFYNSLIGKEPVYDEKRIKWSSSLVPKHKKGIRASFDEACVRNASYRPFCKQHLYYDELFNHRQGQFPRIFPTPAHTNRVICTPGLGATKEFTCFMTDDLVDLNFMNAGTQCFPLYVYTKDEKSEQMTLFDKGDGGYRRESGITDFMLARCRREFGEKVTKEDIFYYIYAVLHSPDYRARFEADLKKSLARIPLCRTGAEFAAFVRAGRKLGDLHCGYENAAPWPECVVDVKAEQGTLGDADRAERGPYQVTKMRFAKKECPVDENRNGKLDRWELEDRSRILYNDRVTIRGIPLAAYGYVVNGKSAIEWVMERYQVTINKDSGIVNDPNLWLRESGDARYILDLLLKVVTVSMETQKTVAKLPKLAFGE